MNALFAVFLVGIFEDGFPRIELVSVYAASPEEAVTRVVDASDVISVAMVQVMPFKHLQEWVRDLRDDQDADLLSRMTSPTFKTH